MTALHTVLAARALLQTLTPLKSDCGRLCSGACCQGDDATGMLLFPDEEALYTDCTFAEIVSADFSLGGKQALLLVCRGACERKNRPLACRLFPLFLTFTKSGEPKVRMDRRAACVCPLTDYGLMGLDTAFVEAVKEAYALLLKDETCAAYLKELDAAFKL